MSPKNNNQWLFHFLLPLFIGSLNTHLSKESDSIYSGQSLSGNQTITSQGGVFELGFFTPGNSQNYYIGIWYKSAPNKPVVWVANRNHPIHNPFSSELKLLENGNLVLLDQLRTRIWSTNSTLQIAYNSTIGILLDTGNFVLRGRLDSSSVIWQSFDHPTDTYLPGGKVGFNKLTNEKQILTSWKSSENPEQSLFSLELEPNSSHVLLWNGTKPYWSTGVWDGKAFSLVPEIQLDFYIKNIRWVSNANESYFTYDAGLPTFLTRFVLDVTGQFKQYISGKDFSQWAEKWARPGSKCQVYNFCGSFSSCNHDVPICACIEGFGPTNPAVWELGDHSDGCERKFPLECDPNRGNESSDTFVVVENARFPDNEGIIAAENIEECQVACLRNCSCTAYAYANGCLIWKNALFNLQQFQPSDGSGKDIHVRVAATGTNKTKNTIWIGLGAMGFVFILSGMVSAIIWRRRRRRSKQGRGSALEAVENSLVVFKFRDIRRATKNFSEKLGEGGFGSVFKGTLPNSYMVAVKSLKNLMHEGEKQFRAEVSTLGMIQHINLVHLRGFCIEGTRSFLVYDYMPKGSLESHLFNNSSNVLDWKTRFNIAIGTARGLTYLHEKCRDRIIHCDIKPENILLDSENNPKVADFGLAKLIGREFSRVLTTIRGTRGYLAPEWISGEAITPKADVFSYGMLLFEMISGRRNSEISEDKWDEYFPFRVASELNEGEGVITALLDYRLEGNCDVEELKRACNVACWCIQDDEKDRPSMGQVVQILEGVLEVGIPPFPRLIQALAGMPMPFVPSSDSSTLFSRVQFSPF